MEVKPGYKLTEVGVIPEDWCASELRKIGKFKNGINKGSEAFGHGHPFVNLLDVFGVSTISSSAALGLVDTNNAERNTYDLRKGDVLFIRSSVKPSGVGLTAVVEENLPKTVYSGFLIRFRDDDALDDGFKRYCFHERRFRNSVIAASSVSANTNINQNSLRNLILAVPPTKREQRAISAALSDVDALLAKLDQLLAKRLQIQRAAMQLLPTGKTRLPGFSGEWEKIAFKKRASLKARIGWQALTTAEYLDSGSHHLVTGTDIVDGRINWASCHFVDQGRYDQDVHIQLRIGDVLVTKDGTIGKVGYVQDLPGPATLNSGVFVIRPIGEIFVPRFLFYVLRSRLFDDFLSKITAGSTITHLYQKDFVGFEFYAPSMDEQRAIADALFALDVEIATLEARRDKTLLLKKGMMQGLLTGGIRLI